MGADAEIRTLLARIAQLADTGDLDEYLTLFTDDAVWAMPDNPAVGHDGQRQARARRDPPGRGGTTGQRAAGPGYRQPPRAHHHRRSTSRATTRATARSYFMFFGTTSTTPTLRTMGQYDDVLVKGERGWQLAHRRITVG